MGMNGEMMRRCIQLPQRSDLLTLPTPDRSRFATRLGRMRQAVCGCPAAHEGSNHGEFISLQRLRRGKRVRCWRVRAQQLPPQFLNLPRYRSGVSAARLAWCPLLARAIQLPTSPCADPLFVCPVQTEERLQAGAR
jgi:hypothetical protein